MKKKLSLLDYFKLDGKLTNIDLDKTLTTYYDSNQNQSISSIVIHSTKLNQFNQLIQLYNVQYTNGKNAVYSGQWIETEVEFKLDEKYTYSEQ